tara:strand:- start:7220 stop:7429 length:210 start_codon:yes stop_codon:yes gene_type:complete
MPTNTRSLICRLQYGDLTVTLTAEGASWNPDVADDLIKRVGVLWKESLVSMLETNTWQAVDPDYDEDAD